MFVSSEYLIWEMHACKLFIHQKKINAKPLQSPDQANMVRMAVSWKNIRNVIQFQMI